MTKYNLQKSELLRNTLRHSNVHDAVIKSIDCDLENDKLKFTLFNPAKAEKTIICFEKVKLMLFINDNECEDDETVLFLGLEDDYSYLESKVKIEASKLSKCLYTVIQMFSENEYHIAAENIYLDIERQH